MSRRAQRRAIAEEAARLMVQEGIGEYIEAKRLAADHVVGMRASSVSLPSNREIRAAIVARDALAHGAGHTERLGRLRLLAWDLMGELARFDPRLIGSVATGSIHAGSDVDLQVFCIDRGAVEQTMALHGRETELVERQVVKDGQSRTFVHLHARCGDVDVELSVYEPEELWVERRSSVDGKPIDRVPRGRVEALLRREHAEAFARHLVARCR